MRRLDATPLVLSPGERQACAGVPSAQLVTVTEGSAWVRGAERIWTPLLTGGCAAWTAGEPRDLWSPRGMRANVIEGLAVAAPQSAGSGRRGRSAVRILCVNDADRVLLWRWPERTTGGFGWLPVGGGIEPGEEPAEAARREWVEETGLDPAAVTEHHVFVHRDLHWEGAHHVADEAFFLARVEGEPIPKPDEMLASECRWTPRAEVELIAEQFEPPQFSAILAELLELSEAGSVGELP